MTRSLELSSDTASEVFHHPHIRGVIRIEYWEAVQNFQKFIVAEARNNGLSPERLGKAVHVALSTAKPKARYAVVPQRFKRENSPVRTGKNFDS